jgi:hypothetical protein
MRRFYHALQLLHHRPSKRYTVSHFFLTYSSLAISETHKMVLKTTLLAAKPPSDPPSPPKKPTISLHHGEAEWTAIYPIIERLYMKDRRKLRHIMQIMEEKHNFKAS